MGRSPARLLAVAGLVLVLMGAGCGQDLSDEEQDKAASLDQELDRLGVHVPAGVAASLYGTDGGAVCAEADDPGVVATEAASVVSHRFTLRRTEADADHVAYLRAVIKTYCPEELSSFDDYVDGLAVDHGDS